MIAHIPICNSIINIGVEDKTHARIGITKVSDHNWATVDNMDGNTDD